MSESSRALQSRVLVVRKSNGPMTTLLNLPVMLDGNAQEDSLVLSFACRRKNYSAGQPGGDNVGAVGFDVFDAAILWAL